MEKVVNSIRTSTQNKIGSTDNNIEKPLIFRKERKYNLETLDIFIIENIIRSHPAMFFKPFPARYVNNIYFDTQGFQYYGDNIVGSMSRKKFRIRWYGNQFGYIKKPVLEIKMKEGLAGAKMHFPLASFSLEGGFSTKTINSLLERSELPEEVRETLRFLEPTLLNQYHRKYFLSSDRKFRLTLDHNLLYTRVSNYQNYFMRKVIDRQSVIMELKYDAEHDEQVDQISDYFPFRMTKNSKYVNGIDLLDLW
jgi:SPX domain protein involved in polyphosphate accumulation